MGTVQFEIFKGEDGKYWWRLVVITRGIYAPAKDIIATSHQGFDSRTACKREIEKVIQAISDGPDIIES